MAKTQKLIRGSILHFLSDPGSEPLNTNQSYVYHEDGGLFIEDGYIKNCASWSDILKIVPPDYPYEDHTGRLIIPGFIDTHIHYPQTDVIASPGHGLLDWLERYTFISEQRFVDEDLGKSVAEFFCDELLRNGTTTALVFGTVHPQSVDAFFKVAQRRGLRMIAGKVMMDRHAPELLRDTPQSSYDDSKRLIEQWHGVDRLGYAITPRFAITSTDAQMEVAGTLAKEFPAVAIHSHVAENLQEVAWVKELFPWSRSYLDVYDHYGLLRNSAVYAHGIYLDDADRQRMSQTGSAIAFSPTSNLFLGSGLLDLRQALDQDVRVGIATDVGGGTSFSMLRTLLAAYEISHLKGYVLPPLRAFYLATLSGAIALGIDHQVGNFQPGKEADFIVLDPQATPLLARRMAQASNLEEQLFLWLILGDDRSIESTYIRGEKQWKRD